MLKSFFAVYFRKKGHEDIKIDDASQKSLRLPVDELVKGVGHEAK